MANPFDDVLPDPGSGENPFDSILPEKVTTQEEFAVKTSPDRRTGSNPFDSILPDVSISQPGEQSGILRPPEPLEGLKRKGEYLLTEAVIKPAKSFQSGVLKGSAATADLLDFYSDKLANAVGLPETKNSIFEQLKNNWSYYSEKFDKEGVSDGLLKQIYKGAGLGAEKATELASLAKAGLGLFTLPVTSAAEGFKEGGTAGAIIGAAQGSLMHGTVKGLNLLPSMLKYPAAFTAGVVTTPGTPEEKVAGGVIMAGMSAGKSPGMDQFKQLLKSSPVAKIVDKIIPPETRESIYQNTINRLQSIENIAEKAKSAGAQLQPGENPANRARSYMGIGGKVQSILENKTFKMKPDGQIEITGEGLKPILTDFEKLNISEPVETRRKDLADYLEARRTLYDLQRPKRPGSQENIATPQQVASAQQKINDLTQKYGNNLSQFDTTAKRLYDYQSRVLSLLVDAGNISQAQYNKIINDNPNYVPFDKVMDSVEGTTPGTPISKNRFTGAKAPIKTIKGSELKNYDPIESMIKNTYRIVDAAERNTVARGVAKLADVLPGDIVPVEVPNVPVATVDGKAIYRPSKFKPKGNVIEYFENGNRKYVEVSKNLYQAMTGLNETSLGMFTKIMSMPASWLRTGATITPEFLFRNFIRDQFTASLQTKLGFKPAVDSGAAVADILGKSDAYNDWLRSGGAYSGFVELSRNNLKKIYNQLINKPNILKTLNVVGRLQDLSQLLEQSTRLGVYKRAIKQGKSSIEAGLESRESTLDFARRGAKTKEFNAMIAFLNAGIQGVDKSIRTAAEDPVGFAAKGVASITIPSIITYMLNRNNPEYDELPRWQKDIFWNVKLGDTWWRIPKPFLYGQIFGSLPERFFEYLDKNDRSVFDGFTRSLYDSVSPVAGDPATGLLATGLKPLIENKANYNFFTERSIVPESRQDLLPPYQHGKYTTRTAKEVGKLINYSPAKIENLAQGWLGGSGRYALQAGDLALNTADKLLGNKTENKRPIELSDIPLVRGFVSRPAESQSNSVAKFFENRDSLNKAYNTYKLLIKQGNKEEAKQILSDNPDLNYATMFNNYSKIFTNYDKNIDRIIKSDRYSQDEKRKQISAIEKKKVELARKANKVIKTAQ